MDLYNKTAYQAAEMLTKKYSTSFSMSCRLFDGSIRDDIYAIYGLVRIADEIVDTYLKKDSLERLDDLEKETYLAIKTGYSANLIVHAFALTSRKYNIGKSLIGPFFKSMRMDIGNSYKTESFMDYIYGSAQVVGLMCLKVFIYGDDKHYLKLQKGALALGSAYQKINFLRDLKDDHQRLGRVYFPDLNIDNFSIKQKRNIEADLSKDFNQARSYIDKLPTNSRFAVALSFQYYELLMKKAIKTSPQELMSKRISVSKFIKVGLYVKESLKKRFS